MKIKHVAMAAALLAAAPAFADLAGGLTQTPANKDNPELFLAVYDKTGTISYSLDLGMRIGAGTQSAPLGGFLSASQSEAGFSQSWSVGDANFNSFLSQANAANLRWEVMAFDTSGTAAKDQTRLFTTIKNGTIGNVTSTSNIQFTTSATAYGTFVDRVNANPNRTAAETGTRVYDGFDGSAVSGINDKYYLLGPGNVGNNGAGQWQGWTADNAVGDSSVFAYITRSGTQSAGKLGAASVFQNSLHQGAFQFAANAQGEYALTYTLAPVPEPESYALLMAGLLALGFVIRRRREDR